MLLTIALLLQIPAAGGTPKDEPARQLGTCDLPGTTVISSFAELPGNVRAELLRFFKGEFAEAGGPFNSTDVVDSRSPVPQRRFLRGYNRAGEWAIWYEHGGIGYHLHVVGLRENHDRSAVEIDPFAKYTGFDAKQLCAASRAFFDGAQTSGDL